MSKDKGGKCSYSLLSSGELRKLKKAIDPHKLKPRKNASRFDLYICRPSGRITLQRQFKDLEGNKTPASGSEYKDTGYNINDLPERGHGMGLLMQERLQSILEFRLLAFQKPPEFIFNELVSLGIQPTEWWKAGDTRTPNTPLEHSESGIVIRDTNEADEWQERVAHFLEALHPHYKAIQRICGRHDAELSCVLYAPGECRPEVSFTKEDIRMLSDLEADIDVDLYFMGEEVETDVEVTLWEFARESHYEPPLAIAKDRETAVASRLLTYMCKYNFSPVKCPKRLYRQLVERSEAEWGVLHSWGVSSPYVEEIAKAIIVPSARLQDFLQRQQPDGRRFDASQMVRPQAKKRRVWFQSWIPV